MFVLESSERAVDSKGKGELRVVDSDAKSARLFGQLVDAEAQRHK